MSISFGSIVYGSNRPIDILEPAIDVSRRPRQHDRVRNKTKRPSDKTLERWSFDGVAKATDGCRVEPDGVCPHGAKSWLLELGLI